MQTCSGGEMTLGLSDSLTLTPATRLNTRVGCSGSSAGSPRSCSVPWVDKQPARRGEWGVKGSFAARSISACNFLTKPHSGRSFSFCSTDSHSPLQTWVFIRKMPWRARIPSPSLFYMELPRTTKNAWFRGFWSVNHLWRRLKQKASEPGTLQSYSFCKEPER